MRFKRGFSPNATDNLERDSRALTVILRSLKGISVHLLNNAGNIRSSSPALLGSRSCKADSRLSAHSELYQGDNRRSRRPE